MEDNLPVLNVLFFVYIHSWFVSLCGIEWISFCSYHSFFGIIFINSLEYPTLFLIRSCFYKSIFIFFILYLLFLLFVLLSRINSSFSWYVLSMYLATSINIAKCMVTPKSRYKKKWNCAIKLYMNLITNLKWKSNAVLKSRWPSLKL